MSKRLTDTDIWDEDWFAGMPGNFKLFWFYLKDSCNHAGIWRVNKTRFEVVTGMKIDLEKFFLMANVEKERIVKINSSRWYLTGFIQFQQGGFLNINSHYHKSILNELTSYNIDISQFTPSEPLPNPQRRDKEGIKNPSLRRLSNIISNKEKEKGVWGKGKNKFDLTEIGELWIPIVEKWLRYKTDRKEQYASQESFMEMVKKLKRLSINDPDTAVLMIEEAMANNWQGFFELKNKPTVKNSSMPIPI